MANELEQLVLKKAQAWLDGHYDEATKKQVKYLIDNDMKELTESFYKDLEFGTGGLRGIMGVGTNRMNVYTVGAATQGLSNYLKKNFAGEQIRVAIGHDSRNNSRMFAEHVADIFASNGFTVFLFDTLRPTPELSFAIRELKCHSGVVVTASHNPKEYNGYKAYWTDGAQVTEPHDKNIIAEVEKITDVDMILTGKNPENITILDEKFDEIYLNKVHELSLSPESVKRHHDLKIVYTPLHGAGVRLVPASLRQWGFTNVSLVEEQAGASVADVFRYEGEARFREAEREALERAIAAGGETVVSTGGGLPTWSDNMQRMNGVGHTVFLHRTAEQIARRLSPYGRRKRPRLRGLDDAGLVAFMERDMAVREPFYAQAHLVVDCDAMSDDQVVEHILRQLGLK